MVYKFLFSNLNYTLYRHRLTRAAQLKYDIINGYYTQRGDDVAIPSTCFDLIFAHLNPSKLSLSLSIPIMKSDFRKSLNPQLIDSNAIFFIENFLRTRILLIKWKISSHETTTTGNVQGQNEINFDLNHETWQFLYIFCESTFNNANISFNFHSFQRQQQGSRESKRDGEWRR